ncbi:hypothetical protein PT015_12885 [Candidatus Mycobacterium wuenschmannii]|uniref:Transmembrane protein n=1 Tax=Candidatus Mycobacterium wuenschmannii TaxID=3027808 RepID=A0ABY8VQE4_9MYCO|nr:hypothetical protein [Candidatus Mycobacterium wuenschmannii]WIM85845.1 hypothetical protein PT015_12885 [Candidatus Mycobacterium wuenschmannii]
MTGPVNPERPSNPETRIIRRAPTGPLPQLDDARTTHIPRPQSPPPPPQPQFAPTPTGASFGEPSRTTAVAAAAVSIVSGWATSVVATDLIAGWWHSDQLFCVAVAFLALIFAVATISGVILLLLRQSLSRYLIVAGAVVAILTYLGVFIAGARVAWVVHTLPILPIASAVLTLLPRTREWLLED